MSVMDIVMSVPKKIFGTRNDRILKRMAPTVAEASGFEPELRSLCSQGDDYDAAFEARRGQIPQPDDDDTEAICVKPEWWRGHHSGFTQIASVSASAPMALVDLSSTRAIDAPHFSMASSSVSPRPDVEGIVETLLTRKVALSRLGSLHGP